MVLFHIIQLEKLFNLFMLFLFIHNLSFLALENHTFLSSSFILFLRLLKRCLCDTIQSFNYCLYEYRSLCFSFRDIQINKVLWMASKKERRRKTRHARHGKKKYTRNRIRVHKWIIIWNRRRRGKNKLKKVQRIRYGDCVWGYWKINSKLQVVN